MKFDIEPVRRDTIFTALLSSPPQKSNTLGNHHSPSDLKLHPPDLYQQIAMTKRSTMKASEAEECKHM
jgi:hypothetical protein